MARDRYIFAGTYSPSDREGIYLLKFDSENGTLKKLNGVSGIENPSFLTINATGSRLYAVSEIDDGAVVSYAFDRENEEIKEINRQPTNGAAPCYVSLAESGKWLFTVNYLGGNVCLYPIEANGAIGPAIDNIQHTGRGIRQDRQEAPHPHSIVPVPASPFVLVPDLGTDRVYVYQMDEDKAKLRFHNKIITAGGTGPRHITFHPNQSIAYVIHELNSTISVYDYDQKEGTFSVKQSVSTLPAGFSGFNTAADIHTDPPGHFLYASNRGDDSIAVFRILGDGKLSGMGFASTEGRTPRNFMVPNSQFVLAANQDSDTIVVLGQGDNGLGPSGETLEIPKPVCLKAAPMTR